MKENYIFKGDVIMLNMIFNFILDQVDLVDNVLYGVSEGSNLLEDKNHKQAADKIRNILCSIGLVWWNIMMIALTGGLWIPWLIFKAYRKHRKAH
jgi:hypothetical protein